MKAILIPVAGLLWLVWVAALLLLRRRPEFRVGTPREFIFPLAALFVGIAWFSIAPPIPGSWFLTIYMKAAVISGALLVGVWLLSLLLRDASIMDVAYPWAAALPVCVLLVRRGAWSEHELLTVALVLLWAARLSLHIGLRNVGHGEDGRYAAWRKRFGKHWWWWSFFHVFATQGVLVWLWSVGLVAAVAVGPQELGWQHALALLLFGTGFYFQAAGDAQLQRFRKHRSDPAQVLDSGVWGLTRHPNYFGEAMIWWSFGALGLVHPWGWVALVCPAYVTWFMAFGSATPMQERYLAKTKPAYADYMRRVPAFFPWGKS